MFVSVHEGDSLMEEMITLQQEGTESKSEGGRKRLSDTH